MNLQEFMNKPLNLFFENDHQKMEIFLNKGIEQPNEIEMDYYHQFRTRLLWHIKMEEKTFSGS
jgi:hypothetical protein